MPPPKIHLVLAADDEVADILQKLKMRREKRLNVLLPKGSVLGHLINARIIQRKLATLKKEAVFLTNDAVTTRTLKKAGLEVRDEPPPLPRGAAENNAQVTWWENLRKKMANRRTERGKTSYVAIIRPNRKPVIAFGLLALAFIVGIVYITLPTATIHIKPVLKIKKSTLNIVMASGAAVRSAGGNGHEIGLKDVSTSFERSTKITPTGRISIGNVAHGKVTLINTSSNDFPIVGNTRLQTNEGLIFLTRNFVTVPSGSATKPGTAVVEAVARDKDVHGVFIGSRGNIGPSTFFLPALSEGSRKLVYAKSFEAFAGGTDSFEYFVTPEDIAAAKAKIKAELETAAAEELKKTVTAGMDGATMRIFERTEDMLKKNVEMIEVKAKENDKVNEFEARGRISVTGFAFDGRQLEDILKANLLASHMSPTEKILKIKEGSLQINEVLEKDAAKGWAKVNASLEAVISYDFLNNNLDLVQEIRSAVVGKPRAAAEKYVNNLKDISEAWITIWPVWTPTLPTIPENIEIVIEEG